MAASEAKVRQLSFTAAAQALSEEELTVAITQMMDPATREKLVRALQAVGTVGVGAGVSLEVLRKQDSGATAAVLDAFASDATFLGYAATQTQMITRRDEEDGEKLAVGVQLAVDKGVLPKDVTVEPIVKVHVMGRTADDIAEEIVKALGDAPSKGCIMALQGLSGTGKGTTVAKLKEMLPNAQTWSNGNLFRSITLLAVTKMEQSGGTLEEQLKPAPLAEFLGMLEFDKYDGKFDVKIEGLGLKYFVSQVEKTVLKEPRVGKNIPTVAEVTQGEVVNFVQVALGKMAAAGINVLLEGREQTLNHIRTPHRFELVLDDTSIIGKRQAALVMCGKANDALKASAEASPSAVMEALKAALAEVTK